MKNFLFVLVYVLLVLIISTNDVKGQYGLILDDPEYLDSLPVLVLSPVSDGISLPITVDNSEFIYFPDEIYNQDSTGSCASVASVYYTFTYEINRLRELPSNLIANKYPPNFTWNFFNTANYSTGSTFGDIWDVLKESGCPNAQIWGNLNPMDYYRWMTGFDYYKAAALNKLDSVSTIYVDTPTDLYTLKHWIYDHNEGSDIGGLAVLGAYFCGEDSILPAASAYAGERIVISWSPPSCGHAVTIVGYCDDIKFDFNGDGQYTNGTNLEDWEIGAVKVANNYGEDWEHGNAGFIWVPYRLLALNNLASNRTYVFHVDHDYTPEILLKVKIYHPDRDNIRVSGQYAPDATYTVPVEGHHYKLINTFGGDIPMQGINEDPLEFSLDFSYWYKNKDVGKIFLAVSDLYSPFPVGVVEYFSFVDYRWGEEFEIFCNESNVSITYPWIRIGINYDLIPHEFPIEDDLYLYSDMVSRFTPTVTNGATLMVEEGVIIDMYNSEIHIDAGSSLEIEDNAVFQAKAGTCKIVVDGNLNIGSNVSFIADEGAEIQLIIDNTSLVKTINNGIFTRARLISNQNTLTLNNCQFSESGGVEFSNGNLVASGCQFDHTNLHISNASSSIRQVNVNNNCSFNNYPGYAVYIENYSIFNISNNTFTGNTTGIGIFWSGTRGRSIINNTISGGGNGIVVYNSSASITSNSLINNGNKIYDNYVGLRCLDNCNVSLTGYSGAKYAHETQVIQDNIYEEVLASEGSFPCPFRYNAIIDNDNNSGNPPYYLVKSLTTKEEAFDVRYNYWSSGFNYLEDLYPPSCYIWEPIFPLNEIGSGGGEEDQLLESAENKIESENYSGAKDDLQTLVEEYSSSVYAKTALKMLYSLEELAGNNYSGLKEYYLTHDAILGDTSLSKLAGFLSNFCDIKLENWPTAIAWFENVIQNPESFEDSIFAIIDLGYTYWLMENTNLKSAYTGAMVQYKFSNHTEFEENRDYLLSLLQSDKLSETMKQSIGTLKPGELLQNVPNPFRETTQIWFKLEDKSTVQIDIYNYTGQIMRRINDGTKTKGTHYIDFDATGLKNGIYFYSIIINGQTTDSKKMTIIQ